MLRRLRGAVSVMTATFIATVGLAVLVSIDIGNLFYQQRALQRSADLAAMAAVQRLDLPTAAQQAVVQNGLTVDGTNVTLAVVPGVWDASAGTAPTYFTAQAAVDGNTNAAQVTITQNVPYFFMVGRRQLTATAIAKNTSIVAFSLGSGLASVDNGLLNQLLGYLLHTNLNIDAVSYQGLATTNIRLADLAVALGAGSMQELLSLSPSLGTFFNAVISVASQSGLAGVSVGGAGASNALSFGSDLNVPINIGDGGASSPGLLQVLALAGNEQAALNATVNVLDLLTTAAQIANSQSVVNVAPVALNLVGLGTVTLSLKIIEPPAIAVGPPGQFLSGPNAGQWRTQARTAQVRLGLDINVNAAGLLAVDLPIALQVAGATGRAKSTSCTVPRSNCTATISVQPQPVSACIASGAATAVNSALNCGPMAPAPVISMPVLGFLGNQVVNVKANISPTANTGWTDVTIAANQIGLNPQQDTSGNSPPRVTTGSVFGSILNSNLSQLQITVLGLDLSPILAPILALTLVPVGQILDAILTPLLEVLGIQLGYADIKLLSLDCDAVELVY
ncbi:TadG family pilus assembly protein [Ralstonia wenshanensis]|uniref:TadG family pilus assembly protein n=1 Tax=Ralstonia wenshanensis TaxID=2842456 RepID=UPI0021B2FE06|nr:TadG family pilus assembly protein [Ralstonia wenshanensis]MCT7305300.1 pilus assembly protein TadG-related protein [Ralstonia wenshanensis]